MATILQFLKKDFKYIYISGRKKMIPGRGSEMQKGMKKK